MKNTKIRDNGGRLIFENATLCSQFLKEYTGMELFKNIVPADIEDMTERYLPMFSRNHRGRFALADFEPLRNVPAGIK